MFNALRNRLRIRQRITTSYRQASSLVTRRQKIEAYLRANTIRKLQVGCGLNRLEGWINTDLEPEEGVLYLDATKPLPFPDGSLDYVFSEHIFEHINYLEGALLNECHRILRPGGKLRISTPDLAFLINLYQDAESDVARRYMRFSMETFSLPPSASARASVVNNFFYNWGHRFIYDFEALETSLREAHFSDVRRFRPKESEDAELRALECHGRIIGEEFNLLESLVIEATKKS